MDSLRQEKVYVHMDKPFYLVGDTIWMKGYLVDARTHRNRMSGAVLWGIERSGFFNGREKWAKGFENQRV